MLPNPTTEPSAFWQMARAMAKQCEIAVIGSTIHDPLTDADAMVTLDADLDIIVAFPGSKTLKDWMCDSMFWRETLFYSRCEQTTGAEVHHGFLSDFDALNEKLIAAVKGLAYQNPTAKIFITGHSLGGALAQLCALEFARLKLPVAGVFTFGSPRVGNKVFANLYDATLTTQFAVNLREVTYRIINANDIVPRVPGVLAGYRHCGQSVLLIAQDCGGGWRLNPTFTDRLIIGATGLLDALKDREEVLASDHHLAAYQSRIKNL